MGVWTEWRGGTRWSNEGIVRLLGFLIEGAAELGDRIIRIVLPDGIRDAAEADLCTLRARIGADFTLHSPRDEGQAAPTTADLADFANRYVPVDAWLSLFPHFDGIALLAAPVTVIFPDAVPLDFPTFDARHWGGEGIDLIWRDRVERSLTHAAAAITFSHHVANEQLYAMFGYPKERIVIVPHGTPDLQPLLPFVPGRRRTPGSRRIAANLLRRHAAERGWRYVADFPFEECRYLAVSTHDRVTKNIGLIADALDQLVREDGEDWKVFMTAELHRGESWTALPDLSARRQLQFDVVSMPDLPREEHAAFYHCAELAVHASFFEGGHAPFPFYEAVSVGTPALVAHGPHVTELLADEPALEQFTFDPYDRDALTCAVRRVTSDRPAALACQAAIFSRLQQRSWADAAQGYTDAALAAPKL